MIRSMIIFSILALFVASALSCDSTGDPGDAGDETGADRLCQQDDFDGPDTAGALTAGDMDGEWTTEGFICPIADHDWYSFSVPEGHHLLNMALSVTGPGSPIQPTYSVYSQPCDQACLDLAPDDRENCCLSRAAPLPEEVGDDLNVTHCLEPGDYLISIRDQADDAQDFRAPRGVYNLAIVSAPDDDTSEPNDGPNTAATMSSAGGNTYTARGQIACRGDQDWYIINDVPTNRLIDVHLAVPIASYQPRFRIVAPDDSEVGALTNLSGTVEPTDLHESYVIPTAGTYYVVVEDDDHGHADRGATYELTVELINDPDPNEPNNSAEEGIATELRSLSCGSSWDTVNTTGTLAAVNDIDVYRVGLSGCGGGVLDVEVSFNGTPAEGLEPSVRIVRSHTETPCDEDRDCRELLISCSALEGRGNYDCAGFGNACLGDVCAGANMCLPGGVCGANIIERHPDFCNPDGTCLGPDGPLQNRPCANDGDCAQQDRIHTAIPLGRSPDPSSPSNMNQIFIVVSDFQTNAKDPSLTYDMRVRVRNDPDTNEPNELYTPFFARTTYECNEEDEEMCWYTPEVDVGLGNHISWGDCITGYLSYERDQDFYTLDGHPCSNDIGCTLRITHEVDGGPVEVYASTSPYDNLARIDPNSDVDNNPPSSGTWGGSGDCLPANPHVSSRFRIMVRDLDYNRDFSADQRYRICFNVQSPTCTAPCAPGYDGTCYFP